MHRPRHIRPNRRPRRSPRRREHRGCFWRRPYRADPRSAVRGDGPRDPSTDHRARHGRRGHDRCRGHRPGAGAADDRRMPDARPHRARGRRGGRDRPGPVPGGGRHAAMSEEQRSELIMRLRQGRRQIPFNQPGDLTRIFAVSSGKGGVGKSTVTANLAAAMAADGLRVGVIDADIHGFSMPGMFGITDQPTKVADLLMPPQAHGVAVMSIGMFVPEGQAVVWRGPKMHRAIEQFASDVYWGDLDVLLLDLPPGTGDVAISVAQLLPTAKMLVVTTPQQSAASVAERVGSLARSTEQEVAGVIENMAGLTLPDGTVMDVFGSGGGDRVAATLAEAVEHDVPVLGRVGLDPALREGSDTGTPLVLSHPEAKVSRSLISVARSLTHRPRGLGGMKLPLSVA